MTNTPELVDAKPVEQQDAETIQEATSLARQPVEPGSILSIIQTALINKTDVETMRELLAIRREERADQAAEAFANALVQFRALVGPIIMTGHRDDRKMKKRDGSYGSVHYDYAELTTTIEQIRPVLTQCGLTPTWKVKSERDWIEVECVLTHVLRHKESSGPMGSPPDGSSGQTPVQKIAGTITSLQRKTLFLVLGLVTMEDDRNLKNAEQGEDEKKTQSQAAITDPENEAKRAFRDLCIKKAGAMFTKDQLLAIFARVQSMSGKTGAADCVAWLEKKEVLLAKDGIIIAVQTDGQAGAKEDAGATDRTESEPAWDQATAAQGTTSGLGGPSSPANLTSPEPPVLPYACPVCGQTYKVMPAGGKCLGVDGMKCAGMVQKVGA